MHIDGLRLEGGGAGLPWKGTEVEGVSWLALWMASPQDRVAPAEPRGEARVGLNTRGGASVLIRMLPGSGYRAHRHLSSEDVLVLAGGYRDETGVFGVGDHVHYAAGSSHAPVALGDADRPIGLDNPACVLFSSVPGGIELL